MMIMTKIALHPFRIQSAITYYFETAVFHNQDCLVKSWMMPCSLCVRIRMF